MSKFDKTAGEIVEKWQRHTFLNGLNGQSSKKLLALISAALDAAVEEEREACAKLADLETNCYHACGDNVAAAIRSRSKGEE